MRRSLNDPIEQFLAWFREQNPTCAEIAELGERTKEEIRPLKPGRNRRFTIEQRQRICRQVIALLAQDESLSLREAWENVARTWKVKPRAIRYEWDHRGEVGFRE
jgi:hypothetical protein